MDFRELFREVGVRRRMFLPDARYLTLVAFVEGCNAATDWRLLEGFNDWVARRTVADQSSVHWATLVAVNHIPGLLDEVRDERQIPETLDDPISDDLLRLLDAFLSERNELGN